MSSWKIVSRTRIRTCNSSLIFNLTRIRTLAKTKYVSAPAPEQTCDPPLQPHPHQLLNLDRSSTRIRTFFYIWIRNRTHTRRKTKL